MFMDNNTITEIADTWRTHFGPDSRAEDGEFLASALRPDQLSDDINYALHTDQNLTAMAFAHMLQGQAETEANL